MCTSFGRRRGLLAAAAAVVVIARVPAQAVETDALLAPVHKLVDGLLRVMKAGSAGVPFSQRCEMLAPVIDASIDLPTALKESIGPTWETMAPDQQQMLLQAFRRYTVSSYVNNFDSYNGQRIEVQPTPRPVGNGEMIVSTKIVPASGDTHELDYVMRELPPGWRAVDVLADGAISEVAVQRSDFRRLLNRGGPQALAQSLQKKADNLAQGMG